MDKKKVFLHLVRAGRDALHREKTLNDIGYADTPYFSIYGEIADAIYAMLCEETETFEESITFSALNDVFSTDEICAENLADACPDVFPHIPETTMTVIREAAGHRGMHPHKLISLILSEWAVRETYRQSVLT